MIAIAFKYLKYKLFSKPRKGHGIHSPFIYELVDKVFQDKEIYKEYDLVEKLKERLLNEERKINIKSFGASEDAGKRIIKKLSSIVKKSSVKEKYGQLLFRLIRYYKPKNILELGTSLGIGTSYMAYADRDARIYTIEGCSNTLEIAKTNFKIQGLNNISTIKYGFDGILVKVLNMMDKVDFVFIDGNHQKESTIKYFEKIKKFAHNDTILVFDDIRWSKGMEEAWNIIKSDNDVTITIDLFFMGLVFFRKESSKQNFIINF